MRIVVAISGASGGAYGVRTLEILKEKGVETYLILTEHGKKILKHETGKGKKDLTELVDGSFSNDDLAAPPASGSFPVDGMLIIPCSISTASKIACGIGDNLVTRAAAVALKERRRLVVAVREAPLSTIHLGQLATLSGAGTVVMPLSPAFYNRPSTLEEVVDSTARKAVSLLGVPGAGVRPWPGLK